MTDAEFEASAAPVKRLLEVEYAALQSVERDVRDYMEGERERDVAPGAATWRQYGRLASYEQVISYLKDRQRDIKAAIEAGAVEIATWTVGHAIDPEKTTIGGGA